MKYENRIKNNNLSLLDGVRLTPNGFPIIAPNYFSALPKDWLLFTQGLSTKSHHTQKGILFFQDDYKFERVWSSPTRYVNLLKQFACVTSPDFSLYADMPQEVQRWNTYRNRLLTAYWQQQGIRVIPTISWSTSKSYDFCFDGIRKGIVAISSVGVRQDNRSMAFWKNGVREMLNRIEPEQIILYGYPIDFDFGSAKVININFIYKKGNK